VSRPVAADIDSAALRHNLHRVRQYAPHSKVMAVIKADGYGHGLLPVALALDSSADAFGVASIDEALLLRQAGIDRETCMLTGFHQRAELESLAAHDLIPVLHSDHQLEMLLQENLSQPLVVWVKVDSGMHRIGFAPARLPEILQRLTDARQVREIRVMSHLANADDPADPYTETQLGTFQNCTRGDHRPLSLANSAGLVAWPATQLDWVRPGIMLYGASPLVDRSAAELQLQPVMHFHSELIAVQRLRQGDPVGYCGIYTCPQDMPVGVVACGYGDGYPRHAEQGTPVWVAGQRVPLVGRVSMDMLTVDLRDHPAARVGDPVQLWGDQVPVDEVARAAGTIAYELLCGVSARVPRHWRE